MKFISLNDVAVHYKLAGHINLPKLVLINSLGTDLRIWDNVVQALSQDYHILSYDKRGHGLTGGECAAYSIDLLSDDLIGLLDILGWKSDITLIGLSVGGLIAQNCAYRFPDKFTKLVLMDTAAKIGTDESWNLRINFLQENGLHSMSDQIMERWLTDEFKQNKPAAYTCYKNMLERTNLQAYIATCKALRDADLTENTSKLNIKTLVLVGEQDLSTPPELVKATAKLIPDAIFKMIDSCGHLPCIEQPDATVHLLQNFMSENIHE